MNQKQINALRDNLVSSNFVDEENLDKKLEKIDVCIGEFLAHQGYDFGTTVEFSDSQIFAQFIEVAEQFQ
jgi:hypothetical protein